MRLKQARVTNYRSIVDTGWFDLERAKTIFVGPNEAGKSAILQALQQINPPQNVPKFDALRDYPRSKYNDITTGRVDPKSVKVVEVEFELDDEDRSALPEAMRGVTYVFGRRLDNSAWHSLNNAPVTPTYGSISKDLTRLCAHIDPRAKTTAPESPAPSEDLAALTAGWSSTTTIGGDQAKSLKAWLEKILPLVDESSEAEEERFDKLVKITDAHFDRVATLEALDKRKPVFVLFNNYYRVKPLIQLDHLAQRLASNLLDDDQYDYGNVCLLKLLGFTAQQLSDLGKAAPPPTNNAAALQSYRDQLDNRSYQLNAASVQLTDEIRSVWRPRVGRAEADKLRISADGQYLKVVVEDDLGVEIELHQRSEGFQWLVSFFVVFFAEAAGKHNNAILLLDEPGLSLHGLKQREFRSTIGRLSEGNQTLYTTHSPFLVGPDELDLVRVVEMADRKAGTKVHTTVASGDPAALLPLQEALGYDLAQSLFTQERNLVLEGLTDYWYLEATSALLNAANIISLNDKIALIPAASAGKVVYYATILYAQNFKVAALLDSDTAGDQAAQQETLVHTIGNKSILRTKDTYSGSVARPEVEDLLRDTLIKIAKESLGIDVTSEAAAQPARPVIDLLSSANSSFSKYKLGKAYIRWTRENSANDLTEVERNHFKALIDKINKVLK
ncbi:ATP-dependent OLD family endonuclease [Pseudomonas sp. 250J]|uniref:AAA family ATPase n=1 Tax=unclassified Pseudomonas TaxID=196821 RepID=UPI0006821B9C|nr:MULTISPECIES: AAA family ATPase [unclassified Pseudomonas]KNX80151.1 ATP-dependent OLD family endonuclease [Pseudomonas sp. 250J]QZA53779.1 ATP-binding protein [Pseudomonas sp. 2hn]